MSIGMPGMPGEFIAIGPVPQEGSGDKKPRGRFSDLLLGVRDEVKVADPQAEQPDDDEKTPEK